VPQGIAAMLQLVPDGDLDNVQAAMVRAQGDVETGEVTRASRTVEINGVSTAEGDLIGLHNGVLAVSGQALEPVLLALLDHMQAAHRELVTLYHGADVTTAEAETMAATLTAAHPNLTVEVHSGGQPHYFYILSVE
jgi:dihydroxyacetone kinase-like predicted kinase